MKIDYSKAYVKAGKEAKAVPASKVEVDGVSLGRILEDLRTLRTAYEKLGENLSDKLIVSKNEELIVDVDGTPQKGKINKMYDGEDLRFYKIENGELKKDKQKVGAL